MRDSRTPRDGHDDLVDVVGDQGRGLLGLGVDVLVELLHHVAEDLVRRLVEVRHTNSRGQPRKVRMLRRHVGRRLGGELIQFMGRDAVVDALDDLLGQDVRLDVLAVEAVAQFFDPRRDLVVSYNFLLAVALDDVDVVVVLGDAGLVPRQVRGPVRFRF